MRSFASNCRISCFCILTFYFIQVGKAFAQTDNVGSGRAVSFDGVDGLINFGDSYKNLEYPFTISAWIYLDPSTTTASPIFSNRNCDPVYTGFRLIVNTNVISLEYGDGLGGNSPVFRRGIQANVDYLPGRWNHITAVVENMNSMRLYLNGINVGGTFTGTSTLPMDSSKPGFGSSAYFISNGTVYRFKGVIDEIRLWNRALGDAEVKSTMCLKLAGTESGLIGYWNFDELAGTTVFDKTSSHVNGSLLNGSKRVYSGAPLGDKSMSLYNPSLIGQTATLVNGLASFKVDNIDNLAGGIQLYYVNASPSQRNGISPDVVVPGYFGAFTAKESEVHHYRASYIYDGKSECSLYTRADNSIDAWSVFSSPIPIQDRRGEYIYKISGDIVLDLGKDTTLCNTLPLSLSTHLPDSYSFTWNTGETTPSIKVVNSGKYKVKVQGNCGISVDSISISFLRPPTEFSLGPDKDSCPFIPQTLRAPEDAGLKYKWQNGSTNSTFIAQSIGTYWVSVSNMCGQSSDTIKFRMLKQVMPIDLGADKVICDKASITIEAPSIAGGAQYLWSNGSSSPSIAINESGTYALQISTECLIGKDTVVVQFSNQPAPFSLGEDYKLCPQKPVLLNAPVGNGYTYKWHDGSQHPSFAAFDYGLYWVKVSNQCGDHTDSIEILKTIKDIGFIPNVITPNGDLKNETFLIEDALIGDVSLKVINRWGNEIYYSPSYKNNWDAGAIPSGIYFVEVSGSCTTKKREILSVLKSD